MKIMLLKGVRPPTDGKIVSRLRPISMITLQASKSHSSKAPKSETFTHATPSSHDLATLVHTETASPHTPELQTPGTQPLHPSLQADKLSTLIKGVNQRIFGLEKLLLSTNNQIQMLFNQIHWH